MIFYCRDEPQSPQPSKFLNTEIHVRDPKVNWRQEAPPFPVQQVRAQLSIMNRWSTFKEKPSPPSPPQLPSASSSCSNAFPYQLGDSKLIDKPLSTATCWLLLLDHQLVHHCVLRSKPVIHFQASRSITGRMRSHASMVGLKLAVLVVLLGMVAGDLTVDQTIINGCTTDITCLCYTVKTPFPAQTLTPGLSTKFTSTFTLDDPSLTCNFTSPALTRLNGPAPQQREVFNLIFSGFSDSPWMSCTAGCTWKTQDDGLYWAQPDSSFKLFNLWTKA